MPVCQRLLVCALAGAVVAYLPAVAQTQLPPFPAATALQAYPSGEGTALGARIAELLRTPEAAAAHWGIAVTALNGTPVFGWNEPKLFRPASTTKLFTTAAAMALLGPEHTVLTSVTGAFDQQTATVTGDLSLVGGGDPSFGTADLPYQPHPRESVQPDQLAVLADRLVALGIHRVRGNIVGNDTLFAQEPAPEGWAVEDVVWGYGTLPSALSIDNNQLRLQVVAALPQDAVTPEAMDLPAARKPEVSVAQRIPWVHVQPNVASLPQGSTERRQIAVRSFSGPTSGPPQSVYVSGAIPVGAPEETEELALNDPAAYAAAALRQLLLDRGVQVDGVATALHTPADEAQSSPPTWQDAADAGSAPHGPTSGACPVSPGTANLLSFPSAPLRDEVVFTLKTSANLHAEMLLHQLVSQNRCSGVLAGEGLALLQDWLLRLGVPEHDVFLHDGSGLSAKDLVTPRAEAILLAYAAAQPWFAAWKAALPIGGVDGTLVARFTTPQTRGNVMAKTGTLGESRALAGYVRCQSGQVLIFSILVDDHVPASSADRTTMDAMVAAIAATN